MGLRQVAAGAREGLVGEGAARVAKFEWGARGVCAAPSSPAAVGLFGRRRRALPVGGNRLPCPLTRMHDVCACSPLPHNLAPPCGLCPTAQGVRALHSGPWARARRGHRLPLRECACVSVPAVLARSVRRSTRQGLHAPQGHHSVPHSLCSVRCPT